MSVLYVVTNWTDHFENNRTRELKNLAWVPMPNRHDGDGYTALLDHPKAASHYGAWCSIVQVASKCDPRGTLVRAGQKPHDSGSLSRITRIPKSVFDEAIPRLVEIGWLTCLTTERESTCVNVAGGCGAGATSPHLPALNGMERTEGKEGNGMEGKEAAAAANPMPESLRTETFLAAWESWMRHRKENNKPYKPTGLAALFKELANLGPDRAAAAIQFSLKQNYQGIFEEKSNGKSRTSRVGPGQQFDPNDTDERVF